MREFLNHTFDNGRLTLELSDGTCADALFRKRAGSRLHAPERRLQRPVPRHRVPPGPVAARLSETRTRLFSETGGLEVEIRKHPFRVAIASKARPDREERGYFEQTGPGFRFRLEEGEKLFGGGSRALGKMDRRGEKLELYNSACYAYEEEARLCTTPCPPSSRRRNTCWCSTTPRAAAWIWIPPATASSSSTPSAAAWPTC